MSGKHTVDEIVTDFLINTCRLRPQVTTHVVQAAMHCVPGLSCGVVCVILRLAVLVEHRLVTDRRTDRRTDGHRATASTADA